MKIPKFNNRENQRHRIGYTEYWHSRSVAINVAVFVRHNHNLYLLTGQRGDKTPDYQGYWNIPCGYLDWDENGTNACYREVWEECGVDLENLIESSVVFKNDMENPWGVKTEPSTNKQNVSLRYGVYLATTELPELTNKYSEEGEVADLEWMKLDDISDLDKKEWAFNHKNLIKEYAEMFGFL